jgi:hypothetical protein
METPTKTPYKDVILGEGKTKVTMSLFESLGDYARLASSNPNPSRTGSDQPFSPRFNYTKSLGEAVELCQHGWQEVRPDVDKLLGVLEERLTDAFGSYFVTEYQTSGAVVDMGRFVTGEPECMMEFVQEPQARMGRVVKIVVNASVSWNIDQQLILNRGVAILALIDTIHKMGVGVELWWEESASHTINFTTLVKLHDSSEPMDIDAIMFALANPDMLRRLQFSVQEQHPLANQMGVGNGYGTPQNLWSVKHNFTDYDIVVEKLQNSNDELASKPLEWVMSTITGLGLVD